MNTYLVILIILSVTGIYCTADSKDRTDKTLLMTVYILVLLTSLIKLAV